MTEEYDKRHKHDVRIVIGDYNAKVGQEEIYKSIVRKYSKHRETNDNGQRMIDFAVERRSR